MKLNIDTPEIVRDPGLTTNHQISLDQNNLIILMDILRNKLYSNPLQSMCREILSNAKDSHVEAGIPDKPIYIQLPNTFSDILVIEDFGVGMSPDKIESVYAKMLNSTKRDSNDQIGGFGIGSKSPFAYTDSFTVVSTYNGYTYSYAVYIDETKMGMISLLDTKQTDKHNGIRIEIPIKQEDFNKASLYIENIVKYWEVQPEGISLNDTEYDHNLLYQTDEIEVYSRSNTYPGNDIAVIDGIPFKIETENITPRIDIHYLFSFVLKFKTGELTLPTNRESLQYDKPTQALLYTRIDKHRKELAIYLYNQIFNNEEDNIIKAYSLWEKYSSFLTNYTTSYENNYSSEVYKYKDFIDFNGTLYNTDKFNFDVEKISVVSFKTNGRRITTYETINRRGFQIQLYAKTTVFYNDLPVKNISKEIKDQITSHVTTPYYSIINPLNKTNKNYDTLVQKYPFLKYFKITKLSSVYTKKKRIKNYYSSSSSSKYPKGNILTYVFNEYGEGSTGIYRYTKKKRIDISQGGIYYEITSLKEETTGCELSYPLIKALKNNNFKIDKEIYGIKETHINKLGDNWIHIKEILKDHLDIFIEEIWNDNFKTIMNDLPYPGYEKVIGLFNRRDELNHIYLENKHLFQPFDYAARRRSMMKEILKKNKLYRLLDILNNKLSSLRDSFLSSYQKLYSICEYFKLEELKDDLLTEDIEKLTKILTEIKKQFPLVDYILKVGLYNNWNIIAFLLEEKTTELQQELYQQHKEELSMN